MPNFNIETVHEAFIDEYVKNHPKCVVRLKVNGYYQVAIPIEKKGK